MRRNFNKSEKINLYLISGGNCLICGRPLTNGWHADHVQPFSLGGKTNINNGQALCKECNLKKGNKVLKLRPFQEAMIREAIKKSSNDKTLVANVHPGSGKTLGCLLAANELYKTGIVDRVVVMVPRVNLSRQFETDWFEFREINPTHLKEICHRDNNPPLIRDKNQDGYVTTYSSLISQQHLHVNEVSRGKTLLILDEAQQLGSSDVFNSGMTVSAEAVKCIGKSAERIFVLSGTPYRADDKPLLFANYGDPDENGFCPLLADVNATYLDGVRLGYLRPFEAVLHDGHVVWQEFGNEPEKLQLSKLENSIGRVLKEDGYWMPLIDKFIDKLNEVRNGIDPRLCGLVAAYNQKHATKIKNYIDKKYKYLKSEIAISDDGKKALKILENFKDGGSNILITVNMAYVGYDYKPISVICILTGYRTEGYLRQLIARGLRMWKDVDSEKQICYAIVPDDVKMQEFVDVLRKESEAGIIEREKFGGGGGGGQVSMGEALESELTNIRSMGFEPNGDINYNEYFLYEKAKKESKLEGTPNYKLKMFLNSFGPISSGQGVSINCQNTSHKTQMDLEKEARSRLSKLTSRADHRFFDSTHGSANTWFIKETGKSVAECTYDEILERINLVKYWFKEGSVVNNYEYAKTFSESW